MIKRLLPFILLLAARLLAAQTPCATCPCIIAQGDSLSRAGQYASAIRQYTAAKACDPEKTLELNRKIENVFAQIDRLRAQALRDKEQTDKNIQKTAALKAKADRDADEAKRQRDIALDQKKKVDRERTTVEFSQKTADSLQTVFTQQAEKTKETLRRLDKALDNLAQLRIAQAQLQIQQLDYDSAATLAAKASALRRPDAADGLRALYLELTYVYNEAGRTDVAAQTADSLHTWYRSPVQRFSDRKTGRAVLEQLDSAGFAALEQRYYPLMVQVEGGTFAMGTDQATYQTLVGEYMALFKEAQKYAEDYSKDELPQHKITLDDFQLAQTETTWYQYGVYCLAKNLPLPESPSWGIHGDHPVVNVSWKDAQGYLAWLNAQTGGGHRLPTEAEWEYAAKGGQEGSKDNFRYAGGNELDELGWYADNANGTTKPVGQKRPNQLDLYDMSGNVWEWCADWYGPYSSKPQKNPKGPAEGEFAVIRGGSWYSYDINCRSANRGTYEPGDRVRPYGFRSARAGR
jgi:formylglycine-generating enzyme required for sulfatase activity